MAIRNTYRERVKCLEVLGLPEGASDDEIRKTYRRLALQHHPDKNAGEDATKKFQEISCAYKYLLEGPTVIESHEDGFGIPFEILIRLFPWLFGDVFLNQNLFGMFGSSGSGPAYYYMDSDEDDEDHFPFCYDDSSDDEWNPIFPSRHTKTTFPRSKEEKKQAHQQQKAAKTQTTSTKKLKKKQRNKRKTEEPERRMPNTSYDTNRKSSPQVAQNEEKAKPDTVNSNYSSSKVPDLSGVTSENKLEKDSQGTVGQIQKTGKKQKKKLEAEQRRREKEMQEIAEQYMKQKEKENQKWENIKPEDKTPVVEEKEKKDEAKSATDDKFENHELDIEYLMEKKMSKRARKNERKRQAAESTVGGGSIYGQAANINSGSVETTEYWTNLTESTDDFWEDIDKKIGRKTTKDFGVDSVYASLGQLDLNKEEPCKSDEGTENVSWYNNIGNAAPVFPDTAMYNFPDKSRKKKSPVKQEFADHNDYQASTQTQSLNLESVDVHAPMKERESLPQKTNFQIRDSVKPNKVQNGGGTFARGRGRGFWKQQARQQNGYHNAFQPHRQQYNSSYNNDPYGDYTSYYTGRDVCYINGYMYDGSDYRTDHRATQKQTVYSRPPPGSVGPQYTYYNSRYQGVQQW